MSRRDNKIMGTAPSVSLPPATPPPRDATYDVIHANELGDFVRAVRAYVANGWRLQGGVAVAARSNGANLYCQAVVYPEQ